LGALLLDFREIEQQFLDRVESASGKPVLLQGDPDFASHATIRIASKDQPAHVLLYKPEQKAVLSYLVASQCEFALRTILANPANQFDLVSRENMPNDVLSLMRKHHEGRNDIPVEIVPELAKQFGNGLGLQLRSMPITMRVDKQIHDAHPELRDQQ